MRLWSQKLSLRPMKKWFFLIIVGLLVVSCLDEPDCLRLADSVLVVSFKKLDNTKDTVILYTVTAESNGQVSDSVFYDYGNEPEADTLRGVAVLLEVNPYGNSTKFIFEMEGVQKFLEVGYNATVRFVSEDCGSETIVSALKIMSTDFDSVRVVNNVLVTSRPVNIEIFN